MSMTTELAQRAKFEAWWIKGNNGCQPRSGWEALRAEDGYNDEDIDMQYEGFKAAAEIYGMQLKACHEEQIAELVSGRLNLQRTMGVYAHAYEEAK